MVDHKIELSQKTILFTIGCVLGLWALYQLLSIIVLLFISFLLMTALNPLIRLGKKYGIPEIIVMILAYFGIIALLSTVIASLVPAVVKETKGLTQALPDYLANLEDVLNTQFDPGVISGFFNTIPAGLLKFAAGFFGNILNVLAIFFITYYLIKERPFLHRYLLKLFPHKDAEKRAENMVVDVERAVGGWVRGQLFLMLIVGVLNYLALMLLGIPYVLPLAVLAGIFEAVPNIGPIVAAIPAVILGFTISPMIGLGAIAVATLIQQLESVLIVPRIMQAATGVKPLVTIVILMAGYTLGGIQGAVLGIPLYLTVQTVYQHMK